MNSTSKKKKVSVSPKKKSTLAKNRIDEVNEDDEFVGKPIEVQKSEMIINLKYEINKTKDKMQEQAAQFTAFI